MFSKSRNICMVMPGWQNCLWSLARQARSSMRISFHGWCSMMLRRSRRMHERTTILWPSQDIMQRQSLGSVVYLKLLPVPNAIQSYTTFDKSWKWVTASTPTSVLTVLIITDLKPQFMAYLTRRSIRVSASSCEHGCSPSVFWSSLELTTPFNRVDAMPMSPVSMTAESLLVSRHPTRSDFSPVSISQMLEDISDFRPWRTPGCRLLWKPNSWISHGIYTWRTVWNFQRGQIEGQEHAIECLVIPSFLGTRQN